MAKDHIGYEALADRALRSVVREALKRAEKQGLIGNHHFFITFKTHDPGVEIPDFLKERFPDEMTIVLQNQFWGLKVSEHEFEVGLSFQKMPTTLVVPYEALTAFVDPSVQFGLQFRNSSAVQNKPAPAGSRTTTAETVALPRAAAAAPAPDAEKSAGAPTPGPQIVSLDKFRKK